MKKTIYNMNSINYAGDIFIINHNKLSKYTCKKLHNSKYGIVEVVEHMRYGKLKVNVYEFNLKCPCNKLCYISTEIIDLIDMCLLDWTMVKYLYNCEHDKFIISDYLKYVELYDYAIDVYTRDINVCEFGSCEIIKTFDNGDWNEKVNDFENWLYDKVESGEIDIFTHVKNLKLKYGLN